MPEVLVVPVASAWREPAPSVTAAGERFLGGPATERVGSALFCVDWEIPVPLGNGS